MQAFRRWDRETFLVAALAACVSVAAFVVCFRHDMVLLYGDAVAHINIARRVFDSRTPGLLQLGTVWLPLPHVLMIPFLLSGWAWRTGVGGSIPSLIAYVAGVVGICRLVRGAVRIRASGEWDARLPAWLAALAYAANPNLIYLQTTAMTEPLYLALFVWAVVLFSEFARQARADEQMQGSASRSLIKCGFCIAGASLTRYDGWFAGAAITGAVVLIHVGTARGDARLRRGVRTLVLLVATVPVSWLTYNGIIYRNPLEFANGPYSARAVVEKTTPAGSPPHPGANDVPVAGAYFFKAAQWNLGEGGWQNGWVGLLLLGSLFSVVSDRRLAPLLLLWLPLPFYALSVAYGGVPISVPAWRPMSFSNVRYGLQLLPAAVVCAAVVFSSVLTLTRQAPTRLAGGAAAFLFVAGSYASAWRADPVCFREAWVNSRTRIALESDLASKLNELPPDSTVLMYLGDHVGALQRAGIGLRRVIHENNHRMWKQPSDPDGLWERALADPARHADYAVAIGGDPVSLATARHAFQPVAQLEVSDHPPATIYRTRPIESLPAQR
jgi:hypothetical protein